MDIIYIKKVVSDPAKPDVATFSVSAVAIQMADGNKRRIPHPYGSEAITFASLEEAVSAVHRAGYDADLNGVRHSRPESPTYRAPNKPASPKFKTVESMLEDSVEVMIALLKDNAPTVVANAAFSLGEMRHEAAILPLIHCFSHDDVTVRKQAAEALGKFGKAAYKPLEQAVLDTRWVVRHSAMVAVLAIVMLGDDDATLHVLPMATGLLKDDNWLVRSVAASVLGESALILHAPDTSNKGKQKG